MHISKAFQNVRSAIIDSLQREHGSPTIAQRRNGEIEQAIIHLKEQFGQVTAKVGETVIWPRMVTRYMSDDDGHPTPVWGPIKNAQGHILGLQVETKAHPNTRHQSSKVYLKWEDPSNE